MTEHIFDNRIYYRKNEWLSGRTTLVFVHGVSGSSSAWWPYEKIFEEKYNILTYDLRGHGMSKKYAEYKDYSLEEFAKDLENLLDSLGVSECILISNSFGSLVVLEYLNLNKKNIIGLVFTSPEIFISESLLTKITLPMLGLVNKIISLLSFSPEINGHVDYNKYPNSTDWSIGRNVADMRDTGLRAHFYTIQQSFLFNNYDLNKIKIPTIVMHGNRDSMVPIKNASRMAREIKNSKFIKIPNMDHNTVHNALHEISLAIQVFIEENNL